MIDRRELRRIPRHDAVFIRALTDPLNSAYVAARTAELNGIPVLDDSRSILVCCDKVHMYRRLLAAGVPAGKLVLGVPFYGRAWEVEGDYGPLHAPGKRATALTDTGYHALRELPGRDGWLRLWDDAAQAPWLWHPARRLFVSYEDPRSLRLKTRLVREAGLGGVMFWEYFSDRSGDLLGTLYGELRAKPR